MSGFDGRLNDGAARNAAGGAKNVLRGRYFLKLVEGTGLRVAVELTRQSETHYAFFKEHRDRAKL